MFDQFGAFVNGNMFAGLFGSTIGVNLDHEATAKLQASGGGPFGQRNARWAATPRSRKAPIRQAGWNRLPRTSPPCCASSSPRRVYAAEDPFPSDANALIATWGTGMGVLVIVLATAGLRSGQRWPWLALWVMPVFFAAHVALLGTWIPDGVLFVLSILALAVTRPGRASVEVASPEAPVSQRV